MAQGNFADCKSFRRVKPSVISRKWDIVEGKVNLCDDGPGVVAGDVVGRSSVLEAIAGVLERAVVGKAVSLLIPMVESSAYFHGAYLSQIIIDKDEEA